MANRQPSPPEPASVTPERGIELLRRQQEEAQRFLANRPLDPDDYEAWQLTTRAYLVDSFGSGSPNVASVVNAGRLVIALVDMPEEWHEERRAECLVTQVKLLGSCIQQLETRVESNAASPLPPGPILDFGLLHQIVVGRCKEPFEAGRYDDATRNAFIAVEEGIRARISADATDVGVDLVAKAMNPKSPRLLFSKVAAEQEAAHLLYRGAIGYIKNPLSHRFLDSGSPVRTFELLTFASLLLRMLDEAWDAE
jgi:uncharacterized protein (TIGR02391 family)